MKRIKISEPGEKERCVQNNRRVNRVHFYHCEFSRDLDRLVSFYLIVFAENDFGVLMRIVYFVIFLASADFTELCYTATVLVIKLSVMRHTTDEQSCVKD